MRAVRGDQRGELVAAGHQHQALRRAGQQRPYLFGITGVVEDHEDPPVGQQAAVQGGLRAQPGRDALRRYDQGVQEVPDGLGGLQQQPVRVEAAQVDVQLAVGKSLAYVVCPAHHEGALAHPRGTGHRRDDDRPLRLLRQGQQAVQLAQFAFPAD